jgi:hypothetical protein
MNYKHGILKKDTCHDGRSMATSQGCHLANNSSGELGFWSSIEGVGSNPISDRKHFENYFFYLKG